MTVLLGSFRSVYVLNVHTWNVKVAKNCFCFSTCIIHVTLGKRREFLSLYKIDATSVIYGHLFKSFWGLAA